MGVSVNQSVCAIYSYRHLHVDASHPQVVLRITFPDLCGSPLLPGEDGIQVSVDTTFSNNHACKPYPCRMVCQNDRYANVVLGGVNQAGRVFRARVRTCNGVGWSRWSADVVCRTKTMRPQAPEEATVGT